jgi:hypothetical protein
MMRHFSRFRKGGGRKPATGAKNMRQLMVVVDAGGVKAIKIPAAVKGQNGFQDA